MGSIALAFAVLGFGSATDLGIVLLAREIPTVVFLLLGGVFADRMSRRSILLLTELAKGAAQAVTAGLLVAGMATVWNVALLQVAFGVAAAFSRPATIGIVKETSTEEHLQQANALTSLSRSVLSVLSPGLGALIVAAGSPAFAIAVDSATFFASAAIIASMRLASSTRLVTPSILRDLRGGWIEFTSRPWAVAMVASFGLFQFSYIPTLYVLGPAVAMANLGGPLAWGLILALGSIGAVVGGLVALRWRFPRPLLVCQLVVLPAVAELAAIAVPLPLLALCVLSFASGVGFALSGTIWQTVLQRHIPDHALSRVSSFDWLGSIVLNPLGYMLVGPLAGLAGFSGAFGISALVCLAAVAGVGLVPSVRALRMDPGAIDDLGDEGRAGEAGQA